MLKKITAFTLIIIIAFLYASQALAVSASISSQTVYVDGEQKELEVYNINNSNYFKLRDLAYVLNGTDSDISSGSRGGACSKCKAYNKKYDDNFVIYRNDTYEVSFGFTNFSKQYCFYVWILNLY